MLRDGIDEYHRLLTDELGHQSVSGEAWLVRLEDGSTWWAARDLTGGRRWIGERVDP